MTEHRKAFGVIESVCLEVGVARVSVREMTRLPPGRVVRSPVGVHWVRSGDWPAGRWPPRRGDVVLVGHVETLRFEGRPDDPGLYLAREEQPVPKTFHLQLDIAGVLKNWTPSEWQGVVREGGRVLTPREFRDRLVDRLAAGERFLPYGECPAFDPVKGCPGHAEGGAS